MKRARNLDIIDLTQDDSPNELKNKKRKKLPHTSPNVFDASKPKPKTTNWNERGFKSKPASDFKTSSQGNKHKFKNKNKSKPWGISKKPANLMSININPENIGKGASNEVFFPSPEVFSHPSDQFRLGFIPNPDDFYQVIERLSCPVDINFASSGAGNFTSLTVDIVRHYNTRQQQRSSMNQKILLWKELYKTIKAEFDCGLFVYGSTFSGFGALGCDIDMCLFPHGMKVDDKYWLMTVRNLLQKHCRHFIQGRIELINAKIPILKFYDKQGNLEVDLSVNNPTSIRNTHLLFCYSQMDYRVRPLVLFVKHWAKNHGINEARLGTLSSYTLTLMVLHFLQSGVSPPVIPCLHQLNPQIFNRLSDVFNLPYVVPSFGFSSSNQMSIGELLVGFFRYYSDTRKFDPSRDVGSIRCGSVLSVEDCERFARLNKLPVGQWKAHLLMEEPFDRTNAGRAVISREKWIDVDNTFKVKNQKCFT